MPKKGIVRINQGRILPLWLRLTISGFLFVGMLYSNLLLNEEFAVFISIALAAPVLPVWNAYHLLEINNTAKVYLKGYWFAGLKFGQWKRFRQIDEITISEAKDVAQLKVRASNKTYAASMLMDGKEHIYLIGSNSKDQLKKWQKEICNKLELETSN